MATSQHGRRWAGQRNALSDEENEGIKERLLVLILIRKGRGRGGAIGLAKGIEAEGQNQPEKAIRI